MCFVKYKNVKLLFIDNNPVINISLYYIVGKKLMTEIDNIKPVILARNLKNHLVRLLR